MSDFFEETTERWLTQSVPELAARVAALHEQRRQLHEAVGYTEVMAHRRALAFVFLNGSGLEVGAGDRPWPVRPDVNVFYGDTRDAIGLRDYFNNDGVHFGGYIDAQSFVGFRDNSVDFVISGHVIEHLPDPIGAIRHTIRVIKDQGIFLLAVPDMERTHDRNRPPTTLEHLILDSEDNGQGTRLQAYEEHVRYVHTYYHAAIPESEMPNEVHKISSADMDIHWHAWTGKTFLQLLNYLSDSLPMEVLAHVPIRNENIFVIRKRCR